MTPPFQIRRKAGVEGPMHPELARGVFKVCKIIYNVSGEIPWITSIANGRHSTVSLHFIYCAADLRSKHLTSGEKHEVLERAEEELSDEYDFILEEENEPNEHFHLEWDKGKFDREAAIRAAWGIA